MVTVTSVDGAMKRFLSSCAPSSSARAEPPSSSSSAEQPATSLHSAEQPAEQPAASLRSAEQPAMLSQSAGVEHVGVDQPASNEILIKEVMQAYEAFCHVVPRRMEDSGSVTLLASRTDIDNFVSWMKTYKETCANKWWTLAETEEIASLLRDLPLSEESWLEVCELVNALKLEDEARAA